MVDTAATLLAVFLGVFAVLVLASAVGLVLRARPGAEASRAVIDNLNARLKAWWVMIILLALAFWAGKIGVIVLFAFVSFQCMREFISLTHTRRGDHLALLSGFFFFLPLQYYLSLDLGMDPFARGQGEGMDGAPREAPGAAADGDPRHQGRAADVQAHQGLAGCSSSAIPDHGGQDVQDAGAAVHVQGQADVPGQDAHPHAVADGLAAVPGPDAPPANATRARCHWASRSSTTASSTTPASSPRRMGRSRRARVSVRGPSATARPRP
jgi:hypothetical protein